jgi:membrane-bound serine protease (ClpP class)
VNINSLIGRNGIAMTVLRPSGQVEIDGRRYEAKSEIGIINAGDAVVVRGRSDFNLVVEKVNT